MARFRQPDEEPSYLVQPKHAAKPRSATPVQQQAPDTATSQDAPRPIGVDPAQTGAFDRITADQGAVVTNRDSAADAVKAARQTKGRSGKRIKKSKRPAVKSHGGRQLTKKALIILAIVLGLVVIVVAVFAILGMGSEEQEASTTRQETQQVEASEGVFYDGYTYSYSQKEDGTWWFERTAEGSDQPLDLFALDGTPVSLIMYNGAFLIPENLTDSYAVMAYVMGDGSVPMQITADGATGSGQIASAQLDGDTLVLTLADGSTASVALA